MATKPAVSTRPRRGRAVAIGECRALASAPARRRAAGVVALAAAWREIAGPLYGRWSRPERLSANGCLLVVVEGPFALQLQHLGPTLIARCAARLGEGQVRQLRFRQAAVAEERPAPPAKPAAKPPAPALAPVADPALAAVLARLAAEVAARPLDRPVVAEPWPGEAPLPSPEPHPISQPSPDGSPEVDGSQRS